MYLKIIYKFLPAILIPLFISYSVKAQEWENSEAEDIQEEQSPRGSFILISKENMTLTLFNKFGYPIYMCSIACGKNYGDKKKRGDLKTPEGVFKIQQIQNASSWSHDFRDGKGIIEGAYGPYFIRLYTPPHRGIGIHGTHDPASMGKRATEGCIRLKNEYLKEIIDDVYIGMPVIILSSDEDRQADEKL